MKLYRIESTPHGWNREFSYAGHYHRDYNLPAAKDMDGTQMKVKNGRRYV